MSKVFFCKILKGDRDKDIGVKIKSLYQLSGLEKNLNKTDFLAIKIHFGESGTHGFINPFWLRPLINFIKEDVSHPFLTDTNTLYQGQRANSVDHLKLAAGHKFSLHNLGIPVIIGDGLMGRYYREIPVSGRYVKKAKIAGDIVECDGILGLAHLTGHCQTGLAGAIKNIAMGCASRAGKLEQHSDVFPEVNENKCSGCGECLRWCPVEAIGFVDGKARINKEICIGCGECTVVCRTGAIKILWDGNIERFQRKMVEYYSAAIQNKKTGFINFLTYFTRNCDCMSKGERALIENIGILASSDPVSIDKASADLTIHKAGQDIFKSSFPDIDWSFQLRYAAELKLGELEYELVEI